MPKNTDFSEYLTGVFILGLFIWSAFFAGIFQGAYQIYVSIIFILFFAALLIMKGRAIFKISDYPLWVFLIAISANLFFAQNKFVAFNVYLSIALPMFVIYYLVSKGLPGGSGLLTLAKVVSIISLIIAFLAVLECIFRRNPLYEVYFNQFYERYSQRPVYRPMVTFLNPTPLGSFLLGCLPFNFLLLKKIKGYFRIIGAIAIVLSVAVISIIYSRGVFLGLISIIAIYFLVQKRYFGLGITLGVLAAILFLSSFFPYPISKYSFKSIFGEFGIISKYKIERCLMLARILREHPFIGIGFEHFRLRFFDYYPGSLPANVPYEIRIADNMYITLLAETGIIGFFGFLFFIFNLLIRSFKKIIPAQGANINWQLTACFMSFCGLLVVMFAYEFMYWPSSYMIFCVAASCLSLAINKK